MADYNYEIVYNKDGSVQCYRFSPGKDGIRYFADNFGEGLIKALSNTGIYFPVALAQKCSESAFGTSNLARSYNNFGGIMNFGSLARASGTVNVLGRRFATFSTPMDCFLQYVDILHDPTKKYVPLGLLTAKTPQEQLKAIANGGYCTSPAPSVYYQRLLPVLELCLKMYDIGKIQ